MGNFLKVTRTQAMRDAIIYMRVQEFRNMNFQKGEGARAIIGGIQFSLFTAARHLVIAGPEFKKYTDSLTKAELDALYAEALPKARKNGKVKAIAPLSEEKLQ